MKQPTPKASTATLSRGRCLCMGTCSSEAAALQRTAAPPQSAQWWRACAPDSLPAPCGTAALHLTPARKPESSGFCALSLELCQPVWQDLWMHAGACFCLAVGGGLVRARPPPTLLTSGCASVPRGVVLAFAGDRRGLMKESCLAGGAQEGSEVAPCCLSGVCGAPEFAVWMWRCRAGLCCEMCAVSVSKSASISAEVC